MMSWIVEWLPDEPAKLSTIEFWLAVALAVAVLAGGMLGFLLWKVTDHKGEVEKRLATELLRETRTELTEAQEKAAADVERTRQNLADAQRTAAAERELANQELAAAKRRTEELEARLAPRRLTEAHRQIILKILGDRPPSPITINFVMSNPEAQRYAFDLRDALQAAGWQIAALNMVGMAPTPVGLYIAVLDFERAPRAATDLLDALVGAGVTVKTTQNREVPAGALRLIVGTKE